MVSEAQVAAARALADSMRAPFKWYKRTLVFPAMQAGDKEELDAAGPTILPTLEASFRELALGTARIPWEWLDVDGHFHHWRHFRLWA